MNIEVRKNTPIVRFMLQNRFWTFFEQEFLLDTWFTWYALFHNSNKELLKQVRKTKEATESKIELMLWNWETVPMVEWKTIFNINEKLESVEFVIIWDEDSDVTLPVVWISFLRLFKLELSMSFKTWTHKLSF